MSQSVCSLCRDPVGPETFSVDPSEFYVGREVVLIQGDRRYARLVGRIQRGASASAPGLYDVKILNERARIVKVRWDHMMFVDRLWANAHYRKLYEQRVVGCSYVYPLADFIDAANWV